MAKEKKSVEVVYLRLPRELADHVERKTEAVNKERKAQKLQPINKQDAIKEIIRQDALQSN